MLKTLRLLQDSRIIKNFEVSDFKVGKDFYYLRIKATISNNTFLFIREYISKDECYYSYHWQKEEGDLIMRWDNSPHHRVKTFLHHKHLPDDRVVESYEINLERVIKYIKGVL